MELFMSMDWLGRRRSRRQAETLRLPRELSSVTAMPLIVLT